ncbi:MAG: TRADD-N-associated membrane domain-containing protein [Pseudonocardiaceae bacterium]
MRRKGWFNLGKVSRQVSVRRYSGFVVILVGVIFAIIGAAPSQTLIPVAGGAIIEAVSLLFVGQDRRNQQRMFEFFERLREDRKLDESLELLRMITDDSIRSRMQAILALHFGGIEDKVPLFETMISDRRPVSPHDIPARAEDPAW